VFRPPLRLAAYFLGDENMNDGTKDFSLFRKLAQDYASREHCAFAVLDTTGRVDISSVGWRVVPDVLRDTIVNRIGELASSRSHELNWDDASKQWNVSGKEIVWPAQREILSPRESPRRVRYAFFVTPLTTAGIQSVLSEELRALYEQTQ
jgi:hypothetical protein